MGDVQFFRKGSNFVLKVRDSAQARIAETWLDSSWGITAEFKSGRYWYSTTLPGELPAGLVKRLRQRAKR